MVSRLEISGSNNNSSIIVNSANASIVEDINDVSNNLTNNLIKDLQVPIEYRGVYWDPDHWSNDNGRTLYQGSDRGYFMVKLFSSSPWAESSSETIIAMDFDSDNKFVTAYGDVEYTLAWDFVGCTLLAWHIPNDPDFANFVGDFDMSIGAPGNKSSAVAWADYTWTRHFVGVNNWPSLQEENINYIFQSGPDAPYDPASLNLYGEIDLVEFKPHAEHLSSIWYGQSPERDVEYARDQGWGKQINKWTPAILEKSQLYRIHTQFTNPINVKLLKAWFGVNDLALVTTTMMAAKGFVFTQERCVCLYTVRARYNANYIYEETLDPAKLFGSGNVVLQ